MNRSGSCDDDYGLDEIVLVPLSADRQGVVAIPPGLLVDLHEQATAQRLAAVGFHVQFNALSHEPGVKNPDVTIDDQIWEMKSPQGAGKNTVSRPFTRAATQATDWSSTPHARGSTTELCSRKCGAVWSAPRTSPKSCTSLRT